MAADTPWLLSPVNLTELPVVSELVISSLRANYPDAWDLEEYCQTYQVENLQKMDLDRFYVVKNQQGEIVATGQIEGDQLRSIFVVSDFQGQGVGRWLISELETIMRQLGKSKIIIMSGKIAVQFYEKLGYHRTGKVYAQGEDIELVKNL